MESKENYYFKTLKLFRKFLSSCITIDNLDDEIYYELSDQSLQNIFKIIMETFPLHLRHLYSYQWWNTNDKLTSALLLEKSNLYNDKNDPRFHDLINFIYKKQGSVSMEYLTLKDISKRCEKIKALNNTNIFGLFKISDDLHRDLTSQSLCRHCYCLSYETPLDCDCDCHDRYSLPEEIVEEEKVSVGNIEKYSSKKKSLQYVKTESMEDVEVIKKHAPQIRLTVTRKESQNIPADDDEFSFLTRLTTKKGEIKKKKIDWLFKSIVEDETKKKERELELENQKKEEKTRVEQEKQREKDKLKEQERLREKERLKELDKIKELERLKEKERQKQKPQDVSSNEIVRVKAKTSLKRPIQPLDDEDKRRQELKTIQQKNDSPKKKPEVLHSNFRSAGAQSLLRKKNVTAKPAQIVLRDEDEEDINKNFMDTF
jgi:hypothetical protein